MSYSSPRDGGGYFVGAITPTAEMFIYHFFWELQTLFWKKFSCRMCRILRHLIPLPTSYGHQTGIYSDGSFFRYVTRKLGTDLYTDMERAMKGANHSHLLVSLCRHPVLIPIFLSSLTKIITTSPTLIVFLPFPYLDQFFTSCLQRSTWNVQNFRL